MHLPTRRTAQVAAWDEWLSVAADSRRLLDDVGPETVWSALLAVCEQVLCGRAEVTIVPTGPGTSRSVAELAAQHAFCITIADAQTLADRPLVLTVRYRPGSTPEPVDAVQVNALIDRAVHARHLHQARAELAAEQTRVTNLGAALVTNRDIGIAIGIVMVSRRCSSQAALDLLREQSGRSGRKLRDVAADVIFTGSLDDRWRPTEQRYRHEPVHLHIVKQPAGIDGQASITPRG